MVFEKHVDTEKYLYHIKVTETHLDSYNQEKTESVYYADIYADTDESAIEASQMIKGGIGRTVNEGFVYPLDDNNNPIHEDGIYYKTIVTSINSEIISKHINAWRDNV